MKNFKQRTSVVVIALLSALVATSVAKAESPVDTYTKLANSRAQLVTARAAMLAAQAAMLTAQVNVQTSLATVQATTVTAQANANKANAEALQGLAQAQALELTNSQKKVEAFYVKRTMHNDYQELAKSRPQSRSQAIQKDRIRSSKVQSPQRLNKRQLGNKSYWPQVLQQPEFSDYRLRISQLFAKCETTSGIRNEVYQETRKIAAQMRAELLSLILQVSPSEYSRARKFIDSLVFEAQFPSGIEAIASSR